MTLLGTRCHWAVWTWFSKHQVYIINVSVARAEIACNKLLIDYREAVLHGKIWPFSDKRGMIIGFRGITFTLKRIAELWQEIISSMYQWLEQKLHIISFSSITERLLRWWQGLAKCRLIVVLMWSIGVFLVFSFF